MEGKVFTWNEIYKAAERKTFGSRNLSKQRGKVWLMKL